MRDNFYYQLTVLSSQPQLVPEDNAHTTFGLQRSGMQMYHAPMRISQLLQMKQTVKYWVEKKMKRMRIHTPLQLSHSFISFQSLPDAEDTADDRHWHITEHCSCRLAQAACVLLYLCVDTIHNIHKLTSQLKVI